MVFSTKPPHADMLVTWQPTPPRYNAVIFSALSGPVITCCVLGQTCSSHPRKELLDTSLLPQDVYDARLAALKAEAAELVAAPRARSSIGDAASPAPTTVTPVGGGGCGR